VPLLAVPLMAVGAVSRLPSAGALRLALGGGPTGVVNVGVGVAVLVDVAVLVGVAVSVGVLVGVPAVGVTLLVGDGVGVAVFDGVGVRVDVGVAVANATVPLKPVY
jgi:hypothetical protein